MKKLYSFSLLFLVSYNISLAQTMVPIAIGSNTTWTLAGSPYIIYNNTTIVPGVTLTIDPGVVVKFDSMKRMTVQGELIAVGQPGQHITFTANSLTPSAGFWYKIYFTDSTVDATYDAGGNYLSGSIMKYCDVSYAGHFNEGTIHIYNSTPHFSNCHISYSASDGIRSIGGAAITDSCLVSNCAEWGMYFESPHTDICLWRHAYDSLISNRSGGLYVGGADCPSLPLKDTVSHCYFEGNTGSGGFYVDGPWLVATHNVFEQNWASGITSAAAITCLSKSPYFIECNTFRRNYNIYGASVVRIHSLYTISDVLRNNIFDNNRDTTYTPDACVVYNLISLNFPVYVSGNTFVNNNVLSGSVCYLEPSTLFGDFTLYVDSNTFLNNQAINDVHLKEMTAASVVQGAFMRYNNFTDNNVQYAIRNEIPFGGPNTAAGNSYWGSTSAAYIDGIIYDHNDNPANTDVLYTPFSGSQVILSANCSDVSTYLADVNHDRGNSFAIYPNPSSSLFAVSLNGDWLRPYNINLQIFDLAGRCVYEKSIRNFAQFEIRNTFSPGVYFVKVSSGERSETKKLIIE